MNQLYLADFILNQKKNITKMYFFLISLKFYQEVNSLTLHSNVGRKGNFNSMFWRSDHKHYELIYN